MNGSVVINILALAPLSGSIPILRNCAIDHTLKKLAHGALKSVKKKQHLPIGPYKVANRDADSRISEHLIGRHVARDWQLVRALNRRRFFTFLAANMCDCTLT